MNNCAVVVYAFIRFIFIFFFLLFSFLVVVVVVVVDFIGLGDKFPYSLVN